MRTNNSAEAYHRRINSIFQCSHPILWVFLQKLIDEQNATHADIVHIKSGQVSYQNPKKATNVLKKDLHLISNPHQHILTQLDSIANNMTLAFCFVIETKMINQAIYCIYEISFSCLTFLCSFFSCLTFRAQSSWTCFCKSTEHHL